MRFPELNKMSQEDLLLLIQEAKQEIEKARLKEDMDRRDKIKNEVREFCLPHFNNPINKDINITIKIRHDPKKHIEKMIDGYLNYEIDVGEGYEFLLDEISYDFIRTYDFCPDFYGIHQLESLLGMSLSAKKKIIKEIVEEL